MQIRLTPGPLSGTVTAPPSKSLAHRAVLCAALADGPSRIEHLERSEDVRATLAAVQQFGCAVQPIPGGVRLTPGKGFATIVRPVDCSESGSTLRFLIPLLSLTAQKVRFVGHGRLMARPLDVYDQLLPAHGVRFAHSDAGCEVFGALQPGRYEVPGGVSSQFLSGLLFALPLLEKPSTLCILPPLESRSYLELTRAVQADYGVHSEWRGADTLYIPAPQRYAARDYTVEGDYSQAAFAAVLGAVRGGISIAGLSPDSRQGDAIILPILQRCGAQFAWENGTVRFDAAPLRGTQIDLADCPDLGPVLMALAALCTGETVLTHAGRLRLKESDRIAAMQAELEKCGVYFAADADTVTIRGGLRAPSAAFDGHGDHRIVMSMAVLALAAGVPACLTGAQAVSKSWPGFFEAMAALGAEVESDA